MIWIVMWVLDTENMCQKSATTNAMICWSREVCIQKVDYNLDHCQILIVSTTKSRQTRRCHRNLSQTFSVILLKHKHMKKQNAYCTTSSEEEKTIHLTLSTVNKNYTAVSSSSARINKCDRYVHEVDVNSWLGSGSKRCITQFGDS